MHNTFLSFVFVCIFGVALVARGGVIDCPPLPQRPPPQSVQFLRPDDIRVVAALGDSITAAFALHDDFFVDGFLEYRGQSFAIGGDKDAYTLPNILKTINNGQRLSGPSIGNSLPLDAVEIRNHIIRPFDPKVDHLNAAQSMAKIDLLFSQVDCLVEEMHKDSEIDFENDWKMITVLIGANNLCECCWGHYNTTPAGFGEQWSELVEKIYNDIPHVVVNVLALFNTSQVYRLDGDREHCKLVHELLGECDCIFGKNSSDATRQQMDDYARLYNEEVQAVIKKMGNPQPGDVCDSIPTLLDGVGAS
eukprot:TRINITY_DN1144_c2_g1_i2.p1 TRINITY_DN1144_c2_g1~~TRINITY_DN1144_c2_g1_i2.p1  ORF type:complete len:305 (+),score=67.02 TRINITY_DN1144_c2_g1_i2:115-1029(+)